MNVLIVNAFSPNDPARRSLVDVAASGLTEAGHEIRRSDLVDAGFEPFMTGEDRRAYHTDEPVVDPVVAAEAEAVQWAEAILVCYPTVAFTIPAALKGWFDRVFLPGIAFTFDHKGRVAPALTRVRRLGVVTTRRHTRWRTWRQRDGGWRTIVRGVRLNCNRWCRVTWIAASDSSAGMSRAQRRMRRKLARW